jgi:hypothetical protein
MVTSLSIGYDPVHCFNENLFTPLSQRIIKDEAKSVSPGFDRATVAKT